MVTTLFVSLAFFNKLNQIVGGVLMVIFALDIIFTMYAIYKVPLPQSYRTVIVMENQVIARMANPRPHLSSRLNMGRHYQTKGADEGEAFLATYSSLFSDSSCFLCQDISFPKGLSPLSSPCISREPSSSDRCLFCRYSPRETGCQPQRFPWP